MEKIRKDLTKLLSYSMIAVSILTAFSPTQVKALGYKDATTTVSLEEGDILEAGKSYTIENIVGVAPTGVSPISGQSNPAMYNTYYDGSETKTYAVKNSVILNYYDKEDSTGTGWKNSESSSSGVTAGKKMSSETANAVDGKVTITMPTDSDYNWLLTYAAPNTVSSSNHDYSTWTGAWAGFEKMKDDSNYQVKINYLVSKYGNSIYGCTIKDIITNKEKFYSLDDIEIETYISDGDEYVSKVHIPDIKYSAYFNGYDSEIDTSEDDSVYKARSWVALLVKNKEGIHSNAYGQFVDDAGNFVYDDLILSFRRIPKNTILHTTLDANQVFEGGKTYSFLYIEHTADNDDTNPISRVSDKYSVDNSAIKYRMMYGGSAGYGGIRVQFDDDMESYKQAQIRNVFGSSYLYYKNNDNITIDAEGTQGNFTQQNTLTWDDMRNTVGQRGYLSSGSDFYGYANNTVAVMNTITFPEGHNWTYAGDSYSIADDADRELFNDDALDECKQMVLHFVSDATECDIEYRSKRTGDVIFTKKVNAGASFEITDEDKRANTVLNDYDTTKYYNSMKSTDPLTETVATGYKRIVYLQDNFCYVTIKNITYGYNSRIFGNPIAYLQVKKGESFAYSKDNNYFDDDKFTQIKDMASISDEYDMDTYYDENMNLVDVKDTECDDLEVFVSTKYVRLDYYVINYVNGNIGNYYVGSSDYKASARVLRSEIPNISAEKLYKDKNLTDEVSADEIFSDCNTDNIYDYNLKPITKYALASTEISAYVFKKDLKVKITYFEKKTSGGSEKLYEKEIPLGGSGVLTEDDLATNDEFQFVDTSTYYADYDCNNQVDLTSVASNISVYLKQNKFKVRYIDYNTKDIIETRVLKLNESAEIDFTTEPYTDYVPKYWNQNGECVSNTDSGYGTTASLPLIKKVTRSFDVYLVKKDMASKIRIIVLDKDDNPTFKYVKSAKVLDSYYTWYPYGTDQSKRKDALSMDTDDTSYVSRWLMEKDNSVNIELQSLFSNYSGETLTLQVQVSNKDNKRSLNESRCSLNNIFKIKDSYDDPDTRTFTIVIKQCYSDIKVNDVYRETSSSTDDDKISRIINKETCSPFIVYPIYRDGYKLAGNDTYWKMTNYGNLSYTFIHVKDTSDTKRPNIKVCLTDWDATKITNSKISLKNDNTEIEKEMDETGFIADFGNVENGVYKLGVNGEDLGSIKVADVFTDDSVSKKANNTYTITDITTDGNNLLVGVQRNAKSLIVIDNFDGTRELREATMQAIGSSYAYDPVTRDGYNLVSTPQNATGTLSTDTIIEFKYSSKPIHKTDVTVNIVDKSNNYMTGLTVSLSDNNMIEDSDGYKQLGLLDGTYDLSVNGAVIGKINLSEGQNSYNQTDNPSYKLVSCDSVDGNYVINLTQTTAKITVIDRYGETEELRCKDTYAIGEAYSYKAIVKDGYELEGQEFQSGTVLSDSDIQIVFHYTKKPVDNNSPTVNPGETPTPDTPIDPADPDPSNPKEPDKPNNTEKPSIPKDDSDNEANDSNFNDDESSNEVVNEEKQDNSNKQKNNKKNVNSSNVAPQTGDQGSLLIKLSMAALAIGIILVTIGLFSVGKRKKVNK